MTGTAASPGTILITDDNRVNRLLLGRGVEHQGHAVAFAENGREALDLLRAQPFDLLLLDVLMPELDGYRVLAELKQDPHLRDIPVIMTSAPTSAKAIAIARPMPWAAPDTRATRPVKSKRG